jgi:hypothetical protein
MGNRPGWSLCSFASACAVLLSRQRATSRALQTALGSSANYSSTANFDHFDLLSSDASKNPDFHDWTGIYIKFDALIT